jgi:hypothetical protein
MLVTRSVEDRDIPCCETGQPTTGVLATCAVCTVYRHSAHELRNEVVKG